MKKKHWILPALFLVMVALTAFVRLQDVNRATVKGRVSPYNAAIRVWAVSDLDTSSSALQNGQFEIRNLKPGKYRIIAEGLRPYKVTTKPGITLNAGAIVDIGEIILDQ
jgi:hypothetical protein